MVALHDLSSSSECASNAKDSRAAGYPRWALIASVRLEQIGVFRRSIVVYGERELAPLYERGALGQYVHQTTDTTESRDRADCGVNARGTKLGARPFHRPSRNRVMSCPLEARGPKLSGVSIAIDNCALEPEH
jgi:hypothetical protein